MMDKFIQGFAIAVSTISRGWKDYALAKMIINENGFVLEDFIQAKINNYDLKEIKKILKKG